MEQVESLKCLKCVDICLTVQVSPINVLVLDNLCSTIFQKQLKPEECPFFFIQKDSQFITFNKEDQDYLSLKQNHVRVTIVKVTKCSCECLLHNGGLTDELTGNIHRTQVPRQPHSLADQPNMKSDQKQLTRSREKSACTGIT